MRRSVTCVVAALALCQASAAQAGVKVSALSNRADLVSGGDVLLAVDAPRGAKGLTVTAAGRDVTRAFKPAGAGRLTGLVTGLPNGRSSVLARLADGSGARLTVTNHSLGGPIFAGPQVKPWLCHTEDNGLGKARGAQCDAPAKYFYFYKSTDGTKSGLQPYDPASPPGDVATTTTDQGKTVPFIVRDERGVMDRGIYDIAMLWDPGKGTSAWNHKLRWPYGESCQPWHLQSANTSQALDEEVLGRGFGVATSGLNVLGANCNTVVSAESTMMLKEHVTEAYGPVRYTLAVGCSGGSIGQIQVAANYPGLLDGLQPSCTYADAQSTGTEVFECRLLLHYFSVTSPHLWTPAQEQFVEGHASPTSCIAWVNAFGFDRLTGDPTIGCTMPILGTFYTDYTGTAPLEPAGTNAYAPPKEADWVYDPKTNPKGVRCTTQDYDAAIFGYRAKDGFAKSPFDNVGVQYGLRALQSGEITPEQFVDVNEKVGGLDIDFNFQPRRSVADPGAVAAAYRSGQVTNGRELARVAIIDTPGAEGEIHTAFHAWSLNERLDRANGTSANHVIMKNGDATEELDLLDQWLSGVEADRRPGSRAEKVLRNRPDRAVDSCGPGIRDPKVCHAVGQYLGVDPRIAAGEPLAADVLKCRLRPLRRGDYPASLTDDQFKRLQATFPAGVCDWSVPGVDQVAPIAWAGYVAGDPGPKAMGPAPESVEF